MAQRAGAIKRRRMKLGLSLIEVARRAGCSLTMIGNLERGRIPQRSAALPKVLEVLDEAEHGG